MARINLGFGLNKEIKQQGTIDASVSEIDDALNRARTRQGELTQMRQELGKQGFTRPMREEFLALSGNIERLREVRKQKTQAQALGITERQARERQQRAEAIQRSQDLRRERERRESELITVTASVGSPQRQLREPNFSSATEGAVYVDPTGRRRDSRGLQILEPRRIVEDANFSNLAGRQVRVTPQGQEVGPDTEQPRQQVRPPAPLAGFERRIERQARRQESFERFLVEDRGQYSGALRYVAERPDVQNIRSFANLVTGGTNVNPFSRRFGMQTRRERRGSVGRVTEDVVFGALSYPILIGAAVPQAAEKTLLVGEAVIRPETRRNVLPELGRAAREVERNEFSFLPGGTPINEAGTTTLVSALAFGALGAGGAGRGQVRTSGPRGPIEVEVLTTQRGTTTGGTVRPPVRPEQTIRLRFTEEVRGAQRVTRGRRADTSIEIRPDGGLLRSSTVGRFRFELEQPAGARRAIAREFRDGELVRTATTRPIRLGTQPTRVTELFRSEEARSVVQPQPDVLTQSRTGARALQVEQPFGRGRTIMGVLEETTSARTITRAGQSRMNPSITELDFTFPRGTDVVADLAGTPRSARTRLRVGDRRQVARQERVRTSQELDLAPDIIATETAITRRGTLRRATREEGDVTTAFDYTSITRGQLFVERSQTRIQKELNRLSEALREQGTRTNRRTSRRVREEPQFELPRVERPRARSRSRPREEGPLETIQQPRARSRQSNEFIVEGLDVSFASPRALEAALRARGRASSIFAPPQTRARETSVQALIPGLEPPIPRPRQETIPEQLIETIPRTTTTPVTDLFTQTTPRTETTVVPFLPDVPGLDAFDLGGGGGLLPVGALPFGGGGGGGFGFGDGRRTRFRTRYNPSIAGALLETRGSRREANFAAATGISVRPLKIV